MCQPCESISDDACLEALLKPYVTQATKRLEGTRFHSMLSTACQEQLMDGFAQQLISCAQNTLDTMVAGILSKKMWLWGLNTSLAPSAELSDARCTVAAQIKASGGAVVDDAAPLLRPVLQNQTNRFVKTTDELLERIWQDRHDIASELLGGGIHGEIGSIAGIDTHLADSHNGGRRTAVVTCDAGIFVYKPRSCSVDLWFARIAGKYLPDALRQPHTIVRNDDTGHWGFAEFVARRPVEDASGIARYWRHFGRAAALFQALGSEDLHCDNFIAIGDVPSLIDMESVITSEPTQQGDPLTSPNLAYASKGFGRDIRGTLAISALLPVRMGKDDDSSPLIARGRKCLPLWEGDEHDVCGYEGDFLRGFEEALAMLAARAKELEVDLLAVEHMPVRRILRDTDAYHRLLRRLCQCDAYDSAKRNELLSILHRPLAHGNVTQSPLAMSEIACLREGDIPYFYAEAGSNRITGSDGTSDTRLLAASAQERALERVRSLDQAHRSFSKAVLEANLYRAIVREDRPVPSCVPTEVPLSADEALEEVLDIFWSVERLVILSPSGESSWLFRNSRTTLIRSTVEFGAGLGGMSVFLAALAPRVRDERVRSRACHRLSDCLDRIEEVIACLEIARIIPERSVCFGMSEGLGGVLHALDLVVAALDEKQGMEAMRNRAHALRKRVLRVLPHADIEHMACVDVYAGGAGLLLALSESPVAMRDEGAAALARRLVRRLLDLRSLGKGKRLCNTMDTAWPISGFAHGQAGVAAALAQGAAAFAIDVETAVCDALSFEAAAYKSEIGTWPDLRKLPASNSYMHGICSGAPGVGLAALMVNECARDSSECEVAEQLLDHAEKACAKLSPQMVDTLCCGNLAVAEFLLSYERRREAGRLLACMVSRKRAFGSYILHPSPWRQTDEPSFLWGLAGIGYVLLRYVDPSLRRVF